MTASDRRLDAGMMERLRCPQCRARLIQWNDWVYSDNPESRWKYPVRDGIPVLLVHEAVAVSSEEFNRLKQSANVHEQSVGPGKTVLR